MSIIAEKQGEADWQLLYEQLERRYGPAVAQDIIDQIRKAENATETPDYMDIKALSEVLERFRYEARAAVKAVRSQRSYKDSLQGQGTAREDEARRCDLEMVFKCYRHTQKAYSRLYRRFMAAYVSVPRDPHRRRRRQPETGHVAA